MQKERRFDKSALSLCSVLMDFVTFVGDHFPVRFSHRTFRGLCGCSIYTAVVLWKGLQEIRVEEFTLTPIHLLWTLYFLKTYPTVEVATVMWQCDSKTFRLWIWRVIALLYLKFDTVIFFFYSNNSLDHSL